MEKSRCVDKLLCVFDLPESDSDGGRDGLAVRVMFHFDRQKDLHEVRILGGNHTPDADRRIAAWLRANKHQWDMSAEH